MQQMGPVFHIKLDKHNSIKAQQLTMDVCETVCCVHVLSMKTPSVKATVLKSGMS